MKPIVIALGCLLACSAHAGVYKCTDSNGKIVYKSGPCPTGQSNVQIDIKTGVTKDLEQEKQLQAMKEQEEQAKLTAIEDEAKKQAAKQAQLKQEARDESEKNQLVIKNNPIQYSAFAIPPYDPDNLPELVVPFAGRLPDVERFRRIAAEKALATAQCGRVESSELNVKSTLETMVFLVDCSTAKKYYFNEQELKP